MNVSDVMTPDPHCLDARSTVRDAAMLMAFEDIGGAIVCDGSEIIGIVTDRDIAIRSVARGEDPSLQEIEAITSRNLAWLCPDDSIDDAERMMRTFALRRLPVIDGQVLVGIVTIGDLARRSGDGSTLAEISAADPNL
jgi:CBS domain-containing protein